MKTWNVFLIYLALALAIMLPILLPGYVLTFDMSWVPHPALSPSIDNLFLFNATIHYLSLLIPSSLVQKILLVAILFTTGIGAHFLAKYLLKSHNPWPPFFAGLLYTINPFTYDRFLDGQYLVLIGYCLLPLFTLFFFKFLDRPHWQLVIPPVLVALAVTITSIHSIFFIFLIALVSGLAALWRRRRDHSYLLRISIWSLVGLLLAALASSYWLVPFFQGRTDTAQEINTFDERQLLTFQTVPDRTYGLPSSINPLTLYGYWGEDQERFTLPKDKMPVWGILFIFIFGLAAIGAFGYFRKERSRIITLLVVFILGWIFAVGIAAPPFSYISLWFYDHIHFFRGYREPQKFMALLALSYAVLGALGLDYLLAQTKSWKDQTFTTMRSFLIVLTLFLPLLYTPTMLFAFAGQLRSSDYPADWYQANDQLNNDHTNFQVLFLPWHHYMYWSFAGRVVSNPAPKFFDKPIVSSSSDELGIIPSNVESPKTSYVEQQILNNHQNLGEKLNHLHVKYVILAQEDDWKDYSWLDSSVDLKLLKSGPTLKIYQNLKY